MDMACIKNQNLTNEIHSPDKFIPDAELKDFTLDWTQICTTFSTISIAIDDTNNFDFIDFKKEEKFTWNNITQEQTTRSPISLTRGINFPKNVEKRQDFTKHRNLWFI